MASSPHKTEKPWSIEAEKVCREWGTNPDTGLGANEVSRRLAETGKNQLQALRPRPAWKILADQFRSLVVGLLCVAAVVAWWFGDTAEGVAVAVVIVINTAIGFFTELRATRSMEALRKLGHFETRVVRDGRQTLVPAEQLVPGDIVILEAGDIVTADLRLLESASLQANESTLTGESMPDDKSPQTLEADTPLAERTNLLFKGTTVTRGSGKGVVIATGGRTELGRIAQLVRGAEAQETPLEKRLDALGQRLVWVMLLIAVIIAAAGMAAGRDTLLAIQVAVALMVAAIPEGLPIVATIALARGMWRMAKRRALIVRLSAVETLGATGVILTDKTGTLTENRMTARAVLLPGQNIHISGEGYEPEGEFTQQGQSLDEASLQRVRQLLESGMLCNNASLGEKTDQGWTPVGDPTEVALLVAGAKLGIDPAQCAQRLPRLREEPFDSQTKAMAVFSGSERDIHVSVKGAPEAVLAWCTQQWTQDGPAAMSDQARREWLKLTDEQASHGLRTLALASRPARSLRENPYQDLTLLGIICLLDPPRAGVREAIERCRSAGIRVVMVTGDHVATARHIAGEIGLLDETERALEHADTVSVDGTGKATEVLARASVIARVSPEQKYDLIRHFQDRGAIVAMTGDGVNDAPALKQADIGVAMGIRGTAVAREAAAMVLQDDRLSTIVEAIAQGRAIYGNIRKFVVYLLSCNISEVLVVALATIAGAPLPLLPLQILFLNLVTDVFPALALGVGEGHEGLMRQAPRKASERILCRRHWARIAAHGVIMSIAVLGAMGYARTVMSLSVEEAVTVSFCTLALAQLWHVFNMRDRRASILHNEVTRNRWVWAALGLCLAGVLGAVYLGPVSKVLELHTPSMGAWLLILAASTLPLLLGPLVFRWTGQMVGGVEPRAPKSG